MYSNIWPNDIVQIAPLKWVETQKIHRPSVFFVVPLQRVGVSGTRQVWDLIDRFWPNSLFSKLFCDMFQQSSFGRSTAGNDVVATISFYRPPVFSPPLRPFLIEGVSFRAPKFSRQIILGSENWNQQHQQRDSRQDSVCKEISAPFIIRKMSNLSKEIGNGGDRVAVGRHPGIWLATA